MAFIPFERPQVVQDPLGCQKSIQRYYGLRKIGCVICMVLVIIIVLRPLYIEKKQQLLIKNWQIDMLIIQQLLVGMFQTSMVVNVTVITVRKHFEIGCEKNINH